MNLNKLKIFAFCAGICVLLSGCETASPEVTDPPQKQALHSFPTRRSSDLDRKSVV